MHARRSIASVLLAAFCALGAAGCAGPKPAAGPERSPAELYARLLGANAGLSSLRAVVEARLSYAGRRISMPGVLLLDTLGGFRLDLLDPLDKPVAMIFSEGGRIVQYRPGTGIAASLGVFPEDCRGVAPEDWVSAILASSTGPQGGERLAVRRLFAGDQILERWRKEGLYESVRFRVEGGEPQPRVFSWYCGEDEALRLKVTQPPASGAERRLPPAFEVGFVKAGLTVALELREVETNPVLSGSPVRPRLAEGTRWTTWRLP
jgi:hypothetical protein